VTVVITVTDGLPELAPSGTFNQVLVPVSIGQVLPEIQIRETDAPVVTVEMASAIRGAPGPAGVGYTWTQDIALSTWTIPHNRGGYPSVTVVDTTGRQVEPDVQYVDENIIQVIHGSPFAGKAFLN